MKKRILIVEDEEAIRNLIKLNLELEGYEIVTADTGGEAMKMARSQYFDLIVLDIMLPEINGFEICEKLRLNNSNIAIIMVSAKSQSEDRIKGLKLGADDYLVKPFHLEELLLRVNKLLVRSDRSQQSQSKSYTFGNNFINFTTFEAKGVKENIILTKKEAQLLQLLIDRKNQAVSREQILKTVWGYDVYPSTRTIDNFILSFRKYFESDPKDPKYFVSVRGVGYKFCHR